MSTSRLILKQPTGWFAAGREVAQALALLSDGAFKLYIHLCLEADRPYGPIRHRLDRADARLAQKMRRPSRTPWASCRATAYANATRIGWKSVTASDGIKNRPP